jgi:glucokinase
MNDDPSLAIGVDLGATKIATALVERSGRVLGARQVPTHADEGSDAVCDRIAGEIRAMIADAPGPVAGIGIGSPGLVDGDRGIVRAAVNLGWAEVHLASEIVRRVGDLPVFVENDANVNAVGEGTFGSAAGSRDYVLLTVGSGLGSGVVSDGRLVTGSRWMAADLGHYAVDPEHGRECPCGHRGCAETVVSGPGLVATVRSMLRERSSGALQLSDGADLTPDAILTAARSGDAVAREAMSLLARWLGEVAAVAAAVVNPDVLVIGGGLGVAAFDLLRDEGERSMYRRLPTTYRDTIRWRAATLSSPAMGSACLVWMQRSPGGGQP